MEKKYLLLDYVCVLLQRFYNQAGSVRLWCSISLPEQKVGLAGNTTYKILRMKHLTATLCLTIAVLLGSVGMSWSADFKRKGLLN